MNIYRISRQTFTLVFDQCLREDTPFCMVQNIKVKPKMIIRDSLTGKKTSFDNEPKAWGYFSNTLKCEILDNVGNVYIEKTE